MFGVPLAGAAAQTTSSSFAVLVFSKTTGFRHDSIREGIAAIRALGGEQNFTVDNTEDAGRFTDARLARYKAVVFINTTGDILDRDQKSAFERYVGSGSSDLSAVTRRATPNINRRGMAGS